MNILEELGKQLETMKQVKVEKDAIGNINVYIGSLIENLDNGSEYVSVFDGLYVYLVNVFTGEKEYYFEGLSMERTALNQTHLNLAFGVGKWRVLFSPIRY